MLKSFLMFQAVLTSLTAVALVASPPLIPSLFGVQLNEQEYVLGYTLAAAEVSTAFLSILAIRLQDRASLQSILRYFVVLHATHGFASAYAAYGGSPSALAGNGATHFVIAEAFVLFLARMPQRLPDMPSPVSSTLALR